MDDKIILYILLGLGWFLFNMIKKKSKRQESQGNGDFGGYQEPDEPQRPRRQLTFEELLREISEAKSQQQRPPQPKPKPKPVAQYVDYDEDLGDEEQDLEDINVDYSKTDPTYDIYEQAKKQAFAHPSLEVSTEEERAINFGKFEEFEEEKGETLLEKYTRELRDPEGFKKAIILNEVLNRKHF